MKSFNQFCENRATETYNWSLLSQEYSHDPEMFEAFLFFYGKEKEFELNELNLGTRLGRMFGGGNKPQPATQPAAQPQQAPSNDPYSQGNMENLKAKQDFQMALRDLKSYYPMGDTAKDAEQRNQMMKSPQMIQKALPLMNRVIQMSQSLGFDQGVERWTKIKNHLTKQIQQPSAQNVQAPQKAAQPAAPNAAPAPNGKFVGAPAGDSGFSVPQQVNQANLSSKVISDTLNKIIAHPHIKQWFQGNKSAILQNLVSSWGAFKKEVQSMQQDPRFPAPPKQVPLTHGNYRGPGRI